MMACASMMLGGSVAVHAIGDRANDRVLDVYQELIDMGADPERLRVEHASSSPGLLSNGWPGSVSPPRSSPHSSLQKAIGWKAAGRGPNEPGLPVPVPGRGRSERDRWKRCPRRIARSAYGIAAAIDRPGFDRSQSLTPTKQRRSSPHRPVLSQACKVDSGTQSAANAA